MTRPRSIHHGSPPRALPRVALALAVALAGPAIAQDEPASETPNAPEAPSPAAAEERPLRPGDPILLVYPDGERVEGVYRGAADEASMRVEIEGLTLLVPTAHVREVVRLPSLTERFRQLEAITPAGNADSLLALASWAEARGLLDEAIEAARAAREADPTHDEAAKRLEVLLQRRSMAPDTDPASGEPRDARRRGAMDRPERLRDFPVLTAEQANLIKVYEVDVDDPPRLAIPPEVVDELFRRYGDHPLLPSSARGREAFRRQPPERILESIFRVRARDLYGEVNVIGLPEGLRRFRDHVHSAWIINAMATTRCHGGSNAGALALTNRRPNDERSFLTNFLILDRYRHRGAPMIDYTFPERSPLLQMGLPRHASAWPHPEIPGWKPVFLSRQDRGFLRTVEWIRAMRQPRSPVPIEYDPPAAWDLATDGLAGEGDRLSLPAGEGPEGASDGPPADRAADPRDPSPDQDEP
jgi:hypothetical protein